MINSLSIFYAKVWIINLFDATDIFDSLHVNQRFIKNDIIMQ